MKLNSAVMNDFFHLTPSWDSAQVVRSELSIATWQGIPWFDPLTIGPVSKAQYNDSRSERSAFLMGGRNNRLSEINFYDDLKEIPNELASRDAALENAIRRGCKIVGWFGPIVEEHLPLLQALSFVRELGAEQFYVTTDININIGVPQKPSLKERFTSLRVMSEVEIQECADLWALITSPTPEGLVKWLADSDPKSQIPSANVVHARLAEFPSTHNGLSCLEEGILAYLSSRGPTEIGRLIAYSMALFFGGGLSQWPAVEAIWAFLTASSPAVAPKDRIFNASELATPDDFYKLSVHITDFGLSLLDNHCDYVQAVGLDRWIGGVHLYGKTSAWRWNRSEQSLVSS